MRARRCAGRLAIEALIALMIVGAILAGTGDVYREGQRLRVRLAAESAARSELASDIARLRVALAGPEATPPRVARAFALESGVAGEIEHAVVAGEPGTFVVESVVRWRAGEHSAEVLRRWVARGRP